MIVNKQMFITLDIFRINLIKSEVRRWPNRLTNLVGRAALRLLHQKHFTLIAPIVFHGLV
jgi:hypothetical protein